MQILFILIQILQFCVFFKMSPNSHAFWSKKENWLGDADVVVAAIAIVVVASVLMCVSES